MSDFTMKLPNGAVYILNRLEEAGFCAYVVGGCVRDALMGKVPSDYDICTSATPVEMKRVFAGERLIETGLQHGTLTVLYDNIPYEVTTFRVDGDYADHRRPDSVTFVRSLREDQARRDFTVNAMAYNPKEGLQDAFEGREDIERKIIRAVGEPTNRFTEDALRILRALRFASVCGFSVGKDTAQAARSLKDSLSYVAKERITAEFVKLMCGITAEEIIRQFPDILSVILPEISFSADALNELPKDFAVRFAYLLKQNENIEKVFSSLRLSREQETAVRELWGARKESEPQTIPEARKLLCRMGDARAMQLKAMLKWKTALPEQVIKDNDCRSIKQLAVTGNDLLALGITGKKVGETLLRLLNLVMEDRLTNEKSELLAYTGSIL